MDGVNSRQFNNIKPTVKSQVNFNFTNSEEK